MTVQPSGSVTADGGDGAVGASGASGGGSGGAIRIVGSRVTIAGHLSARGGDGGVGSCCGDGGGGGGGRIAVLYDRSDSVSGVLAVGPGTSGLVTSGGGYSGGDDSVDPTGVAGVLSLVAGTTFAPGRKLAATFGRKVTVATRLTQQAGGAAVGQVPVTLYQRRSASSPWSRVTTRTTSSSGSTSYQTVPRASTQYQWRFVGTPSRQPSVSAISSVRVAPRVAARARPRAVRQGTTARIFGGTNPIGAGRRVRLERKRGGAWVAVATATVRRQTVPGGVARKVIFVFSFKATQQGSFSYRVVEPAGVGLAQGTSPPVHLRVT